LITQQNPLSSEYQIGETMPSLGEMLQARIARDEEAERQRVAAEAAERQAKQTREFKMIDLYFENAKNVIETAITSGTKIPEITLGKRAGIEFDSYELGSLLTTFRWSQTTPQGSIADASHPYYSVWAAFRNWANENELRVGFDYCHDGMGMESWYVLTVTPFKVQS
jgi:hypothetical protein